MRPPETRPIDGTPQLHAEPVHCPTCHGTRHATAFELSGVPALASVFASSKTDAMSAPKDDIDVRVCLDCATVHNTMFRLRDESHDGSERRRPSDQRQRAYTDSLARRLVTRHSIDQGDVMEIGCGRGELLTAIARSCRARCLGFDQRLTTTANSRHVSNLRLVAEDYSPMRFEESHADLVISRHRLDHVASPRGFLSDLRYALKRGGHFFIEVSNAVDQLGRGDVWNLAPDRSGYFTAATLDRLLRTSGLEPLTSYQGLGGRTLCVEGVLGTPSNDSRTQVSELEVQTTVELASGFATEFERQVLMWNDLLAMRIANDERIAIWGAGSRGVMFLNLVASCRSVVAVVDLNERTHDQFVPNTAQRIVSPECLRSLAIDTVVVANSDHRDEIAAQLRDLGLRCEVLTL